MDKKSEEYLRQYIKLTDTIKQKITVRCWNKSGEYCFSCKKVQLYGFK